MISRSFYFLRHGETEWNKEHRLQGHVDIPLNDNGRDQACGALPMLQQLPIDMIVSSPLARAHETALIINEVLQKPLHVDDRLRERSFGIFEGKTADEIAAWKLESADLTGPMDPQTGTPNIPESESYQDFHDRILAVKNDYLQNFLDASILFVSHGGVYRVLRRAMKMDVDQSPNAQPFHFVRKAPMEWEMIQIK